ncbi:MAG: 50S ribosomal protein L1, partial [Candidatus Bipolaricaulaceae bacterium]
MPKRGKRYRALLEKVDPNRVYTVEEAAQLIKDLATAKFDETVEVHAKLGIDPRKSDQNVRSTVVLPHGTGRQVRVLAIAKGEKIKEAEEAGADYVGGEEIIQKILDGWMDFDVVVATPDVMGAVGSKLGRILGPRGLLPNPKAGTVGFNIGEIIREIKAGRIEFRNDKTGVVHA